MSKGNCSKALAWLLIIILACPPGVWAQQGQPPMFRQEELEQILAPIALHPDDLIAQILMASTYPLEVVQAERFAKQNTSLKSDALTKALEAQDWDPSVKSLVNFPQVLTMMSEKLEWTQKLGDAFIADQKTVLDTIQKLRVKAQGAGNLKTTKEQTVIVEEKVIKIEPSDPQVVYVPTYNPTVVYGAWPYPAYPPYYYYPPGYVASSMFWFGAGMAMSAAWGYAWGSTNWRGGNVYINNSQHININNNINRNRNPQQLPAGGQGRWEHRPEHRKGVGYRDNRTAQRYNRGIDAKAAQSREAFRGRAEQGRQDIARGGAAQFRDRQDAGRGGQVGARDRVGSADRGGQPATRDRVGGNRGASANRGGAFRGVDRGGSSARSFSQRGSSSRGGFSGGGRGARGGGGGRRR